MLSCSSLVEVSLVATFVGRKRAWGRPSAAQVIFCFTIWVLITLIVHFVNILWTEHLWFVHFFICYVIYNETILMYQIMKIYWNSIGNSRKWDSSVEISSTAHDFIIMCRTLEWQILNTMCELFRGRRANKQHLVQSPVHTLLRVEYWRGST